MMLNSRWDKLDYSVTPACANSDVEGALSRRPCGKNNANAETGNQLGLRLYSMQAFALAIVVYYTASRST
jgi:hypothetical protein